MKILYDYQIFSFQKYGGISRYLYEIITRIAKHQEDEVKVIAGLYTNQYLKQCNSDLVFGWEKPLIFNKITKLTNILIMVYLNYGSVPTIDPISFTKLTIHPEILHQNHLKLSLLFMT